MACGAPYSIQEINADTIDVVNLLAIGAYPNAVAVNRAGTVIYAGTSNNPDNAYLYKFDFSTKGLVVKRPLLTLAGQADMRERGVAVDRTGRKVFAVTGDNYYFDSHWKIQVFYEGPIVDSDYDGIVDALDNCPNNYNPLQADADNDGIGNVCDTCNNLTDEGETTTFYADADNDGYGNAAVAIQACSQHPGYSANSTDCNDTQAAVYPGAAETCNGIDDNCNGQIDEGLKTTYYRDADADGYAIPSVTTLACFARQDMLPAVPTATTPMLLFPRALRKCAATALTITAMGKTMKDA